MSVIASELKLYRSGTVSNAAANGGKLSTGEIVTSIKNNIFPDVSQAERLAGLIRFRKIFAKLTNAANEILYNPRYHFRSFTPAEDRVELFEGTQLDTQADITGSERMYGSGALQSDEVIGQNEFVCVLENAAQVIFEATGNSIFITDGVNEEYFHDVAAAKVGDEVTLTLDSGFTLLNNYLAADTIISSVIFVDASELLPTFDSVTDTSVGGNYNTVTAPLEGDNIGTIEEIFTLTFTSATEYDCVGAEVGAVGSGNISSDFAPTNADFSRAYFTLRSAGWGGTWASGDMQWNRMPKVTKELSKDLISHLVRDRPQLEVLLELILKLMILSTSPHL